MTQEHRAFEAELRTKGRRVTGYVAIFNTETRIGDAWTQTIAPGAFARSLSSGSDILALFDHEPTRLLGRTRTGSLRLSEDSRGLAFEIDLPDTQHGRDVLALAERGDLGGTSFGFTATDERRDGDRRELLAVDLFEVSVVSAWPAYPGTVVQARALAAAPIHLRHAQRLIRIMEAG